MIVTECVGNGTGELEGNWSQTKDLFYFLFYVKSLQQARELGEEEASERLDRMGQSGDSILPRKSAGRVPWFYKGNRPYGLFDRYILTGTFLAPVHSAIGM
jgi:hypothetical protein